jgi:hypothetical protein
MNQPMLVDPPDSPLMQAVRPGLRSLRRTWPALLALQVLGLFVVLGYFGSPAVARFAEWLGAVKSAGGYLFSAVSLALVCGPLPEIAKHATGVDRSFTRARLQRTLLNTAIYAVVGVQTDAFYRLLAYAFGDQLTVWNVVRKVAVDQFIFSPLISLPTIALAYTWRDAGFRVASMRTLLRQRWYIGRVVPMTISCWSYWIPMASLMYTLPPTLTFVYALFASAAGAILITSVAGREYDASSGAASS